MSSDYPSRARLFREAFEDALSDPDGADASPLLDRLWTLVARCRPAAGEDEDVAGVLDAFEAITRREDLDAALSEASALFESPQRFREALYFLLCLARDVTETLGHMRRRAYLSAAIAPAATHGDLAATQAALLDETTFEALWRASETHGQMEAQIERWREQYVPVYTAEHAQYQHHINAVVADVEAALWQVDALIKLNTLARLGQPLAPAALSHYQALAELSVCTLAPDELTDALSEAPLCPQCGYTLGLEVPVRDLNETLVAIERALAEQVRRLDRRVVKQVLARPGRAQEARLSNFIRAVQQDDHAGLARALDEGMLAFLEDVLETPEPRVNLIDRLAEAFPEVTDASLDDAVAAFRSLAEDELRRGGGRFAIGREDGA